MILFSIFIFIINNNIINNVSPLRYPGGKTRACKKLESIINQYFNINEFDTLISPFFGGGSFEFYIQNKYNLYLNVNDKFTFLYNFWLTCVNNKSELCSKLNEYINKLTKDVFLDMRVNIVNEPSILQQAVYYFVINRCSFSGATLSGGFSQEASQKRFTVSSIKRIMDLNLNSDSFKINNEDFEEFINKNYIQEQGNELIGKNLIFLDPPYYLEKKSKLYGSNGDMHESFDHERLFNCLKTKKNWIMTYNNCEYIKQLYENFEIIETSWTYGMNKSKKSSEIVIISK